MVHERINFQSKVENNWEKVGPLGGNPSFSLPPPVLCTHKYPGLNLVILQHSVASKGGECFTGIQSDHRREKSSKLRETTKFKHVRGGGGWEERDIKEIWYLKRGSCDIPQWREVYADCKLQTLRIWAAFPIMHRSKGRIYKVKHQQLLQDWANIVRQVRENVKPNPLTPKILLLILPCSCYTFPCILVVRTWCQIKIAASS